MTGKKDAVFASTIESHGHYSPVTEIASNAFSSVKKLSVVQNDENYTSIGIEGLNGEKWIFAISNTDASKITKHHLDINNKKIDWEGPYYFSEQ